MEGHLSLLMKFTSLKKGFGGREVKFKNIPTPTRAPSLLGA